MYWLDLAIICFILWGGVWGYLYGVVHSGGKLLIIWVSICLAHLSKNNLVVIVTSFSPLEQEIKKVISSQMVIAVDGIGINEGVTLSEMVAQLKLPSVIHKEILRRVEALPPELIEQAGKGMTLTEVLTDYSISAIAFIIALTVWMGWLNIGKTLAMVRYASLKKHQGSKMLSVAIGMLANYLIISLFSGLLSAVFWLFPNLGELLEINKSAVLESSLYVYSWLGPLGPF